MFDLSNQLTRSLKAISTYSVILIHCIRGYWGTSLFEVFPTKSEVTSSIENTLPDSCSACQNKTKTTPHLPLSDNFDFGAKNCKSCRLIFLIFNTKLGDCYGYDVAKFEQNGPNLRSWYGRVRKLNMTADDVIELR